MRISSLSIYNQLTRSLHENLWKLTKYSEMMATGKRINKPSDDITGSIKAMDYKVSINQIEQYMRNIDNADSHLGFAENLMSSITNTLTRARELTVEAATDTQTPESRAAIAEEVASLRDEIFSLANSRFRNKYIFSGYLTDTEAFGPGPAFNYQGNTGEIHVMVENGSTIAINVPGDAVFGSGAASLMGILDNLYNTLTNPVSTGNDIAAFITQLDNALDQVANVRAGLGARLNYLDSIKFRLDARDVNLRTLLSNAEDADIAETTSEIAKTELALQSLRVISAEMLSQSLMDFLK